MVTKSHFFRSSYPHPKREENSNPGKAWREEDDIICDKDDGLGERCVVDVHQCTSATCNICKFRGDEVAFLSSPKKGENSNPVGERREEDDIICDKDAGLGDHYVVDVHQCTIATPIQDKDRPGHLQSTGSSYSSSSSSTGGKAKAFLLFLSFFLWSGCN